MLIRRASDIRSSEITPRDVYLNRRQFMAGAGAMLATATLLRGGEAQAGGGLPNVAKTPFGADEKLTSLQDATHYNNFYEFGTDKTDPGLNAGGFKPKAWTVKVDGECAKPGTVAVDDLIRQEHLEERIYRLRCVEGWSMVLPWVGVPLGPVLQRFQPNSKAKFVAFQTLNDPEQFPGERLALFDWPYTEGLRIDEAMNPLALLAVGLYGDVLPPQNGAPIRLVVPWKYGFKSIKSIVSIRFVEQQPKTLWNSYAPAEYGFYSNVNPQVDHPRWSQAKERRIGEFLKRPTLMFNGYGDQVASLYAGMDLKANF
jgi:sulfoxide reductase catalytic subunit YedY